jgi:hypothetical protein
MGDDLCRCGKVPYATEREARAAARRVTAQTKARPKRGRAAHRNIRSIGVPDMHAYACKRAPVWHVGHRRSA